MPVILIDVTTPDNPAAVDLLYARGDTVAVHGMPFVVCPDARAALLLLAERLTPEQLAELRTDGLRRAQETAASRLPPDLDVSGHEMAGPGSR